MKQTMVMGGALVLGMLVGCGGGSTPGGPGVDKDKDSKVKKAEDMVHQAADTFSLSLPLFSTKIKQGETKVISVGISRGKNFDQDVALKVDGLPQGVTVEPAAPVIKHGETESKVTLKATEDAALGDFTAKVTGHPTMGKDAIHDVKLTVEKK